MHEPEGMADTGLPRAEMLWNTYVHCVSSCPRCRMTLMRQVLVGCRSPETDRKSPLGKSTKRITHGCR